MDTTDRETEYFEAVSFLTLILLGGELGKSTLLQISLKLPKTYMFLVKKAKNK
jgi:hypothetical protein